MGMEYRKLPHGEESLSVIGMGTSSIGMAGEKEIAATVELALESGVNFFDMASADAAPFPVYGQVMAGVRDQVHFQVHFGANYQGGTYGWTTDLDTIKRSVDWQLQALKTDYIDFGFLHCLDEEADLRQVLDGGVLDYMADHYDAVIIESFGVGGIPTRETGDFHDSIRRWVESGKTVVMATQVTNEGSNMSVYEIGKTIKKEFGLLEAYDMTLEAAVTKLMWILAQTRDPEEVRRLLYTTVNRDMLFPWEGGEGR